MVRGFRWLKAKHKEDDIEPLGEGEQLNLETVMKVIGWASAAAIAIGTAAVSLRAVPPLQDKVAAHETRITVLETKFDDIKSDTKEIKDLLRGHRVR